MRPYYGLGVLWLMVSASELPGQAEPADHAVPNAPSWGPRPLPRELAPNPGSLTRSVSSDSSRRRPFFLPRQGEHTAYWVGFGAGLALSPLLWCDGPGCGVVSKVSTSVGVAAAGAVSGLLLSRTF